MTYLEWAELHLKLNNTPNGLRFIDKDDNTAFTIFVGKEEFLNFIKESNIGHNGGFLTEDEVMLIKMRFK